MADRSAHRTDASTSASAHPSARPGSSSSSSMKDDRRDPRASTSKLPDNSSRNYPQAGSSSAGRDVGPSNESGSAARGNSQRATSARSYSCPAPAYRPGMQTRSSIPQGPSAGSSSRQASSFFGNEERTTRSAAARPPSAPSAPSAPRTDPLPPPQPVASSSKTSTTLAIRLKCEGKGWHLLGRQSYARTITEAANILGQSIDNVSLWYNEPGRDKCRIHPSAWSAIPLDAPLYAMLNSKPSKAKAKAKSKPKTKSKKASEKKSQAAQQPKRKEVASSQSAQKGKGKVLAVNPVVSKMARLLGNDDPPPSGPRALRVTGSNKEPLGNKPATLPSSGSSAEVGGPQTRSEPAPDASSSKKRAWNADDEPTSKSDLPLPSTKIVKVAGIRTSWAHRRVYRKYRQVRSAQMLADLHISKIKLWLRGNPHCSTLIEVLGLLLRAEKWLQQVGPTFLCQEEFQATYCPEELERQEAEISNATGGTGDIGTQPSERDILSKRSRFASILGSSGPASNEASSASPSKVQEQGGLEAPAAAEPPDAVDAASEPSVSSTSSGSSITSSPTTSSSSSLRPVRSVVSIDLDEAEGRVKKKESDEDDSDFELVSVQSSYRRGRQSTPGNVGASRRNSSDDSDNDSERDELASVGNASERDTSVTTHTGGEDADGEVANFDWSRTFEMPRRSSAKRWSTKEQTIFMEKLRIETDGISHHFNSEERQRFFDRFEKKYGRLFTQRTSSALYNRLATVKKAARAQGKSLPQQLEYLFPLRSSSQAAPGPSSSAYSPSPSDSGLPQSRRSDARPASEPASYRGSASTSSRPYTPSGERPEKRQRTK
ncbi:hypothetical protein A4X09_0g5750 [Tilletia walkeri]|uniref:Uncharacterized protein n=1 Tax=Tilletia walkeri TaxID=117179 RepID=A0A8X7N6K1_9BASI|nr:hypothetical protein A4X09_0g5750 [Tilletia walkeri]